jgi:hypothetical protein
MKARSARAQWWPTLNLFAKPNRFPAMHPTAGHIDGARQALALSLRHCLTSSLRFNGNRREKPLPPEPSCRYGVGAD